MTEQQILNSILRTFGTRSDMRIWRANTGAARFGNQVVRFGIPGQADITGLLLPSGRRLEIEVKSHSGEQRPEQKDFEAMIKRFGGLYILARSVTDVEMALQEHAAQTISGGPAVSAVGIGDVDPPAVFRGAAYRCPANPAAGVVGVGGRELCPDCANRDCQWRVL